MTFIDTSVIIAYLAGDEKIIDLLKKENEKDELKTTTITEYELLKHKAAFDKQLAEEFLSEVNVCTFDRDSAKKAASLYWELRKAGKIINENDILIAGISLSTCEVLLTRDKKLASINSERIKLI